jgi:hypothetical protein
VRHGPSWRTTAATEFLALPGSLGGVPRFVRPALLNGGAGVVVAPRGRPFAVMGFMITRLVSSARSGSPDPVDEWDRAEPETSQWLTVTALPAAHRRVQSVRHGRLFCCAGDGNCGRPRASQRRGPRRARPENGSQQDERITLPDRDDLPVGVGQRCRVLVNVALPGAIWERDGYGLVEHPVFRPD